LIVYLKVGHSPWRGGLSLIKMAFYLEQEILFFEKEGRLHVRQYRKAFGTLFLVVGKYFLSLDVEYVKKKKFPIRRSNDQFLTIY
jgi:hypothetical protein